MAQAVTKKKELSNKLFLKIKNDKAKFGLFIMIGINILLFVFFIIGKYAANDKISQLEENLKDYGEIIETYEEEQLKDKENSIIAIVNGEEIYKEDVAQRAIDISADKILEEMIQEKLILQAAIEAGVEVSDEEVQNEYEGIVKLYGNEKGLLTTLELNGYTKDSYLDSLRLELLANKLLVDDPSEAEAIQFFKDNKEAYFTAQDVYEDDIEAVSRIYIQHYFQQEGGAWLEELKKEAVIENYLTE